MTALRNARSFSRAAGRAVGRVIRLRWVRALGRSALPFSLLVLVPLLVLRFLGQGWAGGGLAAALVVLWVLGCGFWAWRGRPSPFAALSRWDERAGREDTFASAWFFESEGMEMPAAELHLTRAREDLTRAMGGLASDLPLPLRPVWWLLPPALMIAFFLPWTRPAPGPGEAALTGEMAAAAAEEGERLAGRDKGLEGEGALNEEERERLAALQEQIDATADELGTAADRSAREVLAELEARARAAEKLAERLGEGDESWASEAMVAEMLRHADTADLGEAVAEKDAAVSGTEAGALADKLQGPDLAAETSGRIGEALERVMEQALEEDREKLVGSHVAAAEEEMSLQRPGAAGEQFAQLADRMRRMGERQRAQDELEKLAQQLREAGSNIAGQNAGGMEKLAGQPAGGEGGGDQAMPQMEPLAGELAAPGSLTPPGMQPFDQLPQGQGSNSLGQSPPPGQGELAPAPGEGQTQPGQVSPTPPGGAGAEGAPMLLAPVPGASPGEDPAGMAMVPVAGSRPGAPGATLAAPVPGLNAGVGTAPLEGEASGAEDAKRDGVVSAQRGSDGASTFRAVEGGARDEDAALRASRIATDFIAVEEQALDEAQLPLSRRRHVLRYFTNLRKSFESTDHEPEE